MGPEELDVVQSGGSRSAGDHCEMSVTAKDDGSFDVFDSDHTCPQASHPRPPRNILHTFTQPYR